MVWYCVNKRPDALTTALSRADALKMRGASYAAAELLGSSPQKWFFPLIPFQMWGRWQTGDNMATLCGEKERQRNDAPFFYLFLPKKKKLGLTGFDPRSKPPADRKSNTLTTTPHFPAVINGSDANTRENQIVLFLPLDGSATGPFRWTIPLRLIVHIWMHLKFSKYVWPAALSILVWQPSGPEPAW